MSDPIERRTEAMAEIDDLPEEEEAEAEELHRRWPPSAGAVALARLTAHERRCSERYGLLIQRVARLETVTIAAAGSLIIGLIGLIGTLVSRLH